MNFRNLILFTLRLILLVLVQIFFLKNLALFGQAFAFLYLLGLLILPLNLRTIPLLLIAFGMGLVIDVFYETIGMHTAAATFMAFARPIWLKAVSPTGGYDDMQYPTLSEMGTGWFLSYAFPLVFAFSIVFFSIDHWGFGSFFSVLNKSFFSSTLTCLLAILVQLLFFKRRRGI
ncbi:rod shape-determining protein MreD [Algoriphagus boseongensis]|uniref:Rod shape-determining protein MreD n=1 Tax=Algoriphagus boseongensis TaxID=1442587 RepID=A0A4R6T4Z0_9BACT|nr:rod shape-determining protein MreD [Algoriphagus boseongensis]TDQ13777.1 rod shape-determining protein MreD [Algoriphagus boseongensis]